jgi:predicted nuclease of predicted toxin-antitoxin system
MRVLADENISRTTVEALRGLGHDVAWVRRDAPGSGDEQVIALASAEARVLITEDTDFGELAFRRGLPAKGGVILLRIRGSPEMRIAIVVSALQSREDWADHFAVIENDRIRLTRLPGGV